MPTIPGTSRTTPLASFLDLLKRRLVVALSTGAVIMACLLAWFLSVTPLFEAEAKLVVDQSRRAVDFSPASSDREDRYSLMNTQRDLLTSYPVLEATATTLGLNARKGYAKDPIGILGGRLKAISNKDSWMIDLAMRDENPREAEHILTTVIEQYQIHERRRHQLVTKGSVELLSVQAESAKLELLRSRDEEQKLRLELGIISSDPERNPLTEKLGQLELRLVAAERDLAQAETLHATMAAAADQPAGEPRMLALVQIPELRREQVVQTQFQQYTELIDQRGLLLKEYLETNPEVVQLDARITTSRERLESLLGVVRAGLEHQRHAAKTLGAELRSAIAATKLEIAELGRNLARVRLKSEEVGTRERIYQTLINRQHEEEAGSLLVGQVVTVVEEPHAGGAPVNVRRGMALVSSLLLGLLAAAGAALLAETFDLRVRDAESITELTDLPTLGLIPHCEGLPMMGRRDDRAPDRRLHGVEESFRMMRSALQLSIGADAGGTRLITITSPSSGDGRSSVVARLGASLAAAGRRVLLIDGDLRLPGLHRQLGFADGGPGLAELLAGTPGIKPLQTSWPRLDLLVAGKPPENSAELLQSPTFHAILSDYTEVYDYIIFDAPPLEFSEALELGALADDILLVIRDRFTSKQALRLSQTRLGRLRGKVLGLIINGDRTLAAGQRGKDERSPAMVTAAVPAPSSQVYRRQDPQIFEPVPPANPQPAESESRPS
jgi:polysaccharide biosynthesis transport protein